MATRAQRPFFAYAPVQTDKTAESLAEILREITEIRGTNPPTADELERVQHSNTLSLPGRWETNPAILAAIAEIVSYGLPEDFWNTYPERLNDLTLEQVTHAGQALLEPDNLTWVVIGDRERIEAGLTNLNIGQIRLIDVEGQFVDANISSKTATD